MGSSERSVCASCHNITCKLLHPDDDQLMKQNCQHSLANYIFTMLLNTLFPYYCLIPLLLSYTQSLTPLPLLYMQLNPSNPLPLSLSYSLTPLCVCMYVQYAAYNHHTYSLINPFHIHYCLHTQLGTHAALLAKGGIYAELIRRQTVVP